jgi:protein-tyrosine phosphatase
LSLKNPFILGEKMNNKRKLSFNGVTNLRDLGGYSTNDGRIVKWGKLFRSDQLTNLSEAGQSCLQKMGLKLIIDLRTSMERRKKPNPKMKGITDVHFPIYEDMTLFDRNMLNMVLNFSMNRDVLPYFTNMYRKMVTNTTAQNSLRNMLDLIIKMDDPVVLWHCRSGKDRTGFVTAIILLILGVPKKTIMKDYLLTNTFRSSNNDNLIKKVNQKPNNLNSGLITFLKAEESYLQAAFDEMKLRYGSTDSYIKKVLGVSVEKRNLFKKKFLT